MMYLSKKSEPIEKFIHGYAKILSSSFKGRSICDEDDLRQIGYLKMLEVIEIWPTKEGNFEAYAVACVKRAMTRSARVLNHRLLESIEMFFVHSYDHVGLHDMIDLLCEHKELTTKEKDFIQKKINNEDSFMSRSSEWRMKKSIASKLREGENVNA